MAEASATSKDSRSELDRIGAAVAAGGADLSGLGFWRIVARVKRDRTLVPELAHKIAEIDTRAFRSAVRLRVPIWAGNAILSAGLVVGAAAVAISRATERPTVSGVAAVAAGAIWSVSVHCLAHWATGRALGIRFTDYFIGGPFPPRPGLKIDYESYLGAAASARAAMHASGAIATKVAPFVALALTLGRAPAWASLVLAAFGAAQIATDVLFSVRSSDWKKVKRERAVARETRSPRVVSST
jgi:hypothetical protein